MEFILNIGILGYGTVGQSVADILHERDCGVRVQWILRRAGKAVGPQMTDNFESILADPTVTCIVEALPGRDPALAYIRAALTAGKHVVTSNKAALAADLEGLTTLAKEKGVKLLFEASCGGGMPWIEMIKKATRLDDVTEVSGILNGTCNYMLDHMERFGLSFEDALAEAQRLGYAEADPTADISGADLRNKAVISASLAFNGLVNADIPMAGIERVTHADIERHLAEGYHLRLMMLARRAGDRYAAGVVPIRVSASSIPANIHNNLNYGALKGDLVGLLTLTGQGAGGHPTANAMIQDLISINRGTAENTQLNHTLTYDPTLLCGTGFFSEETIAGRPLAELVRIAHEKQSFLAFEPEVLE